MEGDHPMKSTLILLRHGQSLWNKENRFTGWTDVDLTQQGIDEAHQASQELLKAGLKFDIAFTSVLKRAIRTLWIVLDDMDLMWVPVERDWRLNERHYGALQGLNKAETAKERGAEQVHQWRRSFDVRPPALALDDPRHPRFDPHYTHLKAADLPATEALVDTLVRVMPYWEQAIAPRLRQGAEVLVSAHGNSLRALVKLLDHISDDDISQLNIPTGIPRVYELDENLNALEAHYLGDPAAVEAAASAVGRQAEVG
jgi:2,3-bisphosphoglycerate-dependent phosphoglycerate mutase